MMTEPTAMTEEAEVGERARGSADNIIKRVPLPQELAKTN
jgi:hypothetical protein